MNINKYTSNKMAIYVNNEKRISDFLNTKVEHEADLLRIENNEKVDKFLKEYMQKVFTSVLSKDIKDFYNETGIKILHIIEIASKNIMFFIDESGVCSNSKFFKCAEEKIFNHHLLVITKAEDVIKEEGKVYVITQGQKKCIYDFKDVEEYDFYDEKFAKYFYGFESSFEKIEKYFHIDKNSIKEVRYIPEMYKLYILLKDGTLYENDKIYTKNVKKIWKMNDYCYYIIYNNNVLEPLTFTSAICEPVQKYKKIIYQENRLITFSNNGIAVVWEPVEINQDVVLTAYKSVKNVEYDEEKNNIYIVCEWDSRETLVKKSRSFVKYNL